MNDQVAPGMTPADEQNADCPAALPQNQRILNQGRGRLGS
jgi:hypothetical protein